MPPRLAAADITLQYAPDSPPVLAGFTLPVPPGVFLGIIGPNGSGKSTLIRALSRTLRPAGGAILLDDADLYAAVSARESAQRIGVVPQDTAVSLDFTVRDVVRMGRSPHLPRRFFASETAGDEQIVSDALAAARVGDLADRSAATLSGGERQRVLLARALAQQPAVILLDEPTAHLDLQHQGETLALARDLAHREGKAVLAVLHDISLAAAYCDRLVLLDGGKIAAQGAVADVLTAVNIQRVYGARVWVRRHPVSGRPLVLPLPPSGTGPPLPGLRVHVVCGGGTGAALLAALTDRGCTVTAAGLSDGDPDAEMADALGIAFARAAPFSPLSEAVLAEAMRLSSVADAVVLTDVPVGPANLANLHAALALRRAGKPVFCLDPLGRPFAARDFTPGLAAPVWGQLLECGAETAPTLDALLSMLENFDYGNTD